MPVVASSATNDLGDFGDHGRHSLRPNRRNVRAIPIYQNTQKITAMIQAVPGMITLPGASAMAMGKPRPKPLNSTPRSQLSW